LNDYYNWLLTRQNQPEKPAVSSANAVNYKERKVQQNRMKKLEQIIDCCQKKLATLESELADPALYEQNQQDKLKRLLGEQEKLRQELNQAEDEWLTLADEA